MHKAGGMIKSVTASAGGVEGESIPAPRRGGALVIDLEVKEKIISVDGFITPMAWKIMKRNQGVQPMERDLCGDGRDEWKHLAVGCCTGSSFRGVHIRA